MKIKNAIKITTLAAVTAFTLSPLLCQAEAFEPVSGNDKLVRIRPAGNTGQTNALDVQINTEKNSYRPNEKIRFQVKSNKQVFIYLFNLDPATGKALLILPNRIQSKHQIKYPGDNKWHLLPNEALEFYADRPGIERLLMVASEKYIDIDKKLQNMSSNKSVGDFYAMDNPLDDLDASINETYNPGVSGDKLIRIRNSKPTSPSLPSGIVTREVNLRVR